GGRRATHPRAGGRPTRCPPKRGPWGAGGSRRPGPATPGAGPQPPQWFPARNPPRQGPETPCRRGSRSLSYAYRQDLNWLVTDFTTRVTDVAHAVVVSAVGGPLALSKHIPHQFAEQLAALTWGLASRMAGAARIFEAGQPTQALVDMEAGLMSVMAISDGSSLAVLAAPECDTDLVAYEMSLLVEAVGDVLTPAARAQGLSRVG